MGRGSSESDEGECEYDECVSGEGSESREGEW